MVCILSSTADSLFMMHISGGLPTQAVLVMSSVLATALTILTSVLELASHTLESLRSNLARHSLGSSMANESRDAVKELGVLFHIQENLIECTKLCPKSYQPR